MEAKCPFAAPITSGRAACHCAHEVVRRGGSEYDCEMPASHERCCAVHARLRAVGLKAFDVDDDLTSMPHSVLVKIQSGGLTGLQRLLSDHGDQIEDVDGFLDRALSQFGGLDNVPFGQLAPDMVGQKLERRTRRRGRRG
jgi:hypothetical protein